jgi:hypothetical protein
MILELNQVDALAFAAFSWLGRRTSRGFPGEQVCMRVRAHKVDQLFCDMLVYIYT